MQENLPDPICKAFLVCHRTTETDDGESVLVGVPTAIRLAGFPAEVPLGFFARVTNARGEYSADVILETVDGELKWLGSMPGWLKMHDPLMYYDLRLNLLVEFPAPGDYQFVLKMEGHEIARQRFKAASAPVIV
jgi:hypothetical protein